MASYLIIRIWIAKFQPSIIWKITYLQSICQLHCIFVREDKKDSSKMFVEYQTVVRPNYVRNTPCRRMQDAADAIIIIREKTVGE